MAEATASPSRLLDVALWLAQLLAEFAFAAIGTMKLTQPIAALSQTVHWAAEFPEIAVRSLGLIDLAGGIGLILPALSRIAPELTVWAVRGCVALQFCAIAFHALRGELAVLPLNFVLVILCAFIWWGRSSKVPIAPRNG